MSKKVKKIEVKKTEALLQEENDCHNQHRMKSACSMEVGNRLLRTALFSVKCSAAAQLYYNYF